MANPKSTITVTLLNKTKKGFASINKSLKTTRAAVNSTKLAVGVLAGAAGFGLLVKSAFSAVDATAKLSDSIGISTEALAGYQFLAGQAGVSTADLNNGFKKLTNSVGEAVQGVGTAAPAFEELGISAQDLAKQNPDEQFKRIAEAIGQVGDRSTQAAIAQDIFGRKGTDLLRVLDKGREGIEAYQKEAEMLGATFSRVDAAKVEAANDAFDKLSTIFTGFFNRVAVTMSPLIIGIANDLKKVILESGGFQTAIDKAFSFGVRAVGVFANGIRGIQIAFNFLKGTASLVIGGISGMIGDLLNDLSRLPGAGGLKGAANALLDFGDTAFKTFDTSIEKANELSLAILPSEVIKAKITEYKAFANTMAIENAKIAKSNAQPTEDITEAAKKEQARIDTKFTMLKAENENELLLNRERLNAKLAQDIEFLSQSETIRVTGEKRANDLIEQSRRSHSINMLALEKSTIDGLLSQQIDYSARSELVNAQLAERQRTIDALSAKGKRDLAAGAFRDVLSIAATGSKKMFELNKKVALAEALINGFRAIQSGFATAPFYPVGIAMGALAAVKTAAQVSSIRSTSFSGGGSTPTAPSGGAPTVQGQSTQGDAPTVQGPVKVDRKANITVQGDLNTRERVLEFAQNLVELRDDGFTAFDVLLGEPA